ncbi:hypothetical protein CcaverHIS002_0212030 [Cutaneotrichosporon cavernicola]|nr:hypothetical protein CcaverHIS002_0212030 [Cutaneotrichosporon cavernicola]BEI97612.1 hypothetical protein CcaverHIS631_0212010 [Cutaneotrichosporon cavernicola]
MSRGAAKLREMIQTGRTIVSPGVYEGLGARVCLQNGFDTLYMTGAGTAIGQLGMPDLGLTTADDMVRNAAMLAGLDRNVPVIADADTGFGGPVMVQRTVMQKRCGHLGGKELVDEATFLARIRAAVAARERTHSDIVIIARTDALQSLGFDAAIDRLKKAVEAGADMCFLEGMTSKEQMAESVKQLSPTPCMLNMVNGGVTPLVDAKETQAMGYALVIWPIFALMAAFNAYEKAAKELKSTGFLENIKDSPGGPVRGGVREVFELCGMNECVEFDRQMGGGTYAKGGP